MTQITKFDKPIEIIPGTFLTGFGPAETEADRLAKKDIFVKGTDIYILDSFAKKSGTKIGALKARTRAAIARAKELANYTDELMSAIVAERSPNYDKPVIKIHLNCPDTTIDSRARDVIDILSAAVKEGVILEINNIGASESAWARTLNAMVKMAQAKPVTKQLDLFAQHTK